MAETQELTIEQRLEALEQSNVLKDQHIAQLQLENKIVREQASDAPAEQPAKIPKIPETNFTVNGKTYKFLLPHFRMKVAEDQCETISAIDALNDQEILAHLVAIKSGLIKEVE